MIELSLTRNPSNKRSTIGSLFVNGEFFCYTCEDQVRENFVQTVEQWKVPGETAIPVGRYKLSLEDSPRFGKNTLTLDNVRGFTHIRIHAGNTYADTEGCILVGVSADMKNGTIGQSRVALAKLKERLVQPIKDGEDAYITISGLS